MRNVYDQFGKQIGFGALTPCGPTVVQDEITRDAQHADLRHEPNPGRDAERARIGLLGRIASVLCLIEIYGHATDAAEVRACLGKYIAFWEQRASAARKKKRRKPAGKVEPFLWIIAAGRPTRVLRALKFTPGRGWPRGVYFFGDNVLRVGVVVARELPRQRSTILVRLMAAGPAGPLLRTALEDLAALPADAAEHAVADRILLRLQHELAKKRSLTPKEEELAVSMNGFFATARAEGALTHARAALRRVLAQRALVPSAAEEARIDRCKDVGTLDRWLDQALTAQTAADALRGGAVAKRRPAGRTTARATTSSPRRTSAKTAPQAAPKPRARKAARATSSSPR